MLRSVRARCVVRRGVGSGRTGSTENVEPWRSCLTIGMPSSAAMRDDHVAIQCYSGRTVTIQMFGHSKCTPIVRNGTRATVGIDEAASDTWIEKTRKATD